MKNRAIFLDIDGVVIHDPQYLSKPDEIIFLPGVIEALRKAQGAGYILIFISNKGGAYQHKGLTDIGLKEIDLIFKKMLEGEGLDLTHIATYYCPHYWNSKSKNCCRCRKPDTALFKKAIVEYKINKYFSYAIGDKMSDLIPALRLSCKGAILVKRNQDYFDVGKIHKMQVTRLNNLTDAIDFILHKKDN